MLPNDNMKGIYIEIPLSAWIVITGGLNLPPTAETSDIVRAIEDRRGIDKQRSS